MAFTDSLFCGRGRFEGFNPSVTLAHNSIKQTSSITVKLNPKCKPRNEISKQNTMNIIMHKDNFNRRIESFSVKRKSCQRKYPIQQRRSIIVGDLPNDY